MNNRQAYLIDLFFLRSLTNLLFAVFTGRLKSQDILVNNLKLVKYLGLLASIEIPVLFNERLPDILRNNSKLRNHELVLRYLLVFKEVLVLLQKRISVMVLDITNILVHLFLEVKLKALLIYNLENLGVGFHCVVEEELFTRKLDLNHL